MSVDLSALTISTTRPNGKPAIMLAEMGISVVSIEEDMGDIDLYVLSKRLAIERRPSSSFLQGIVDKMLYINAIYLQEHFDIPVLIVEGELSNECRGINPQAVRGALSSMMLVYGLNVLSTPSLEETVQLITMMARQEQIGTHEVSLVPKRKAVDLPDMQRRVVEMLPGCGMVTARELLQHFGSIKQIVNATEEEFQRLEGIGEKKAEEIYRVLNTEYESVDTEKDLEDILEAAPEILFKRPVTLLARQHCIYTEEKERYVVDMVFMDSEAEELILVELKRGKLTAEHYNQIRRYLDNAYKSRLLLPLLEKGIAIRGILATVEECQFEPKDPDISVFIVDEKPAIEVLKRLRRLKDQ